MASKYEKASSDYKYSSIDYRRWEAEFNGRGGAGDAWNRTSKDNPNYERNLANYKKGKAEGDKLKAEVDKYAGILKDIEAEKQKESNIKKAADKKAEAQKALDLDAENLQKAKDVNDAEAIKIAQAKVDASNIKLTAAKEAQNTVITGIKKKSKINSVVPTADNTDPYLKSLTIADNNGSLSVQGTDAKPVYFIPVKPNTVFPGQKVELNQQPYSTIAMARAAYLKSIGPNGIDNLKKSLLASGYINSTQYKTNDYLAGLDVSINDFSVFSLQGYQFENKKDFGTIESFIASQQKKSGINLTKTTSNIDFSTRTESDTLVNEYFNGLLGRSATQNERDQYFKELHAAENKAVANQTVTRDTEGAARSVVNVGSVLTDTDRLVIAGKIAKPYLTGTNIDKVISGGGIAAQNIRDMEAYSNAYGIKLDPVMALNYVADSLTPGSSLDKQKERIRQTSMTMYKNLKDHISGGGTVADIAQQYQRSKMNILELPASQSDVMDSDIQNALNDPKGLMSITDYNLSLYKDPRYRFTAGAHDRAAQMANSILQSFGLVS